MGGSARHVVTHSQLLWRITRNEISARYAGSFLGAAWVFIAPMLILGVYGLVYVSIFRFQPEGMSSEEYVLYIFSGLVPYLVTAEALATSIGSVSANKSILTNTVFPIDLVPVKAVLMSLATMTVGIVIIVAGATVTGNLHITIVLLPVVVLLQVMALIGIAWIVSLLNVVFRDLQNLIAAVLMILLIASPIAYTPAMVPESLKPFLALNPFSYYVFAYQKVLILGRFPSPWLLGALIVMSTAMFLAGSWFFDRAKRVIIDYV
jgi:lipopolysaccharide transport system permease protein